MLDNLVLGLTAFTSLYFAIRFYGLKSFLVIGIAGSIIYAIPAIINMTPPQQFIPTGQTRYFITPSNYTIYAYCAYCLFIIINILILKRYKKIYRETSFQKKILH